MGTKRLLVEDVREAIVSLERPGAVVDLFSGMGSVAASLADVRHVVTNDVLSFTSALARPRFLASERATTSLVVSDLVAPYLQHKRHLQVKHAERLARESAAIATGPDALYGYIEAVSHVGNSTELKAQAQAASRSKTRSRYQLATLYFSAGYYSTRQSIDIDSIRYAIDTSDIGENARVHATAAWLMASGAVINSPGHTAQFLMPTSASAFVRLSRQWRRSVWSVFLDCLEALEPVGTKDWRSGNRVMTGDALELLQSGALTNDGVVYADPPYTKDQYSRYYHVYETLYRYDFPDSEHRGRYRSDRYITPFSQRRKVEAALRGIAEGVADLGLPLVLSYPADGLLAKAGGSLADLLDECFSRWTVRSLAHSHSTMGRSTNGTTIPASEQLYVCEP